MMPSKKVRVVETQNKSVKMTETEILALLKTDLAAGGQLLFKFNNILGNALVLKQQGFKEELKAY